MGACGSNDEDCIIKRLYFSKKKMLYIHPHKLSLAPSVGQGRTLQDTNVECSAVSEVEVAPPPR
jgi:hypothetical protein